MSRSNKQKAVALKYNAEQDTAPVVIASGYGEIAQRIIDIAEQKGIPVYRDDSAASLLCMLEVGSSIPAELYEIIAAIYVQILQKSEEIKNSEGIPNPYARRTARSERLAMLRRNVEETTEASQTDEPDNDVRNNYPENTQ